MVKNMVGSIENRVSGFLFIYHQTPHSTTGQTPAELLLGRKPRSHFDLIRPSVSDKIKDKQYQQKNIFDEHAKPRSFKIGDTVWVHDLPLGKDCIPGMINLVNGPSSFHVLLENSKVVRRHVDHIRFRSSNGPTTNSSQNHEATELLDYPSTSTDSTTNAPSLIQNSSQAAPIIRRSTHSVVSPDRYGFPREDVQSREGGIVVQCLRHIHSKKQVAMRFYCQLQFLRVNN